MDGARHCSLCNQLCGKITAACAAQAWYMNPVFSVLIGGILPFGAVFIELFFILTSMWLHQFYYLFGFLCLVFVILIITCAEITIVLCYFQLCSEDYHWWCAPQSPFLGVCSKTSDGHWHPSAHPLPPGSWVNLWRSMAFFTFTGLERGKVLMCPSFLY